MVKIGCLTVLTFRIGNCRAGVHEIENNRHNVLRHTLLENWNSGYETLPYPPAHGPFAVYTVDDLRSGINFTVSQFYNAEIEAAGNFNRTKNDSLTVTIQYYDFMPVKAKKNKTKIVKQYSSFKPDCGLSNYTNADGQTLYTYNISKDLHAQKLTGVLKRLFEVNLTFALHAVRVDEDDNKAVCHRINGTVSFHDQDQDGQFVLELKTKDKLIKCADLGIYVKDSHQCDNDAAKYAKVVEGLAIITVIVDGLTFLLGLVVLIFSSVYIGWKYQIIYQDSDEVNLPFEEYLRNVQWWLFFASVGDIFTLIGILGILGEGENRFDVQLWMLDRHVVFLGYGYLLTLFSSLRFLKISHKFSVLFKTVRRSASDVLFFLACVLILFVGFWLSSFIVLGPYHIKFQSKSTSAETLFSLINGDEIYATFAILQDTYSGESVEISTFARVIICVYVSLFTVLVFNLLIAMFNNAYDAVKESYEAEKEVRPLVTALRNYINYKKESNTDNGFSEGIRMLLDSRVPLNTTAESEMRSILRKYLSPRHSDDELPVAKLPERTLFFFMSYELTRENPDLQEKDCCCCITRELGYLCSWHTLLGRMFVKCKCRVPDNS